VENLTVELIDLQNLAATAATLKSQMRKSFPDYACLR
jgi:hypothetical protein